MISTYQQNRDPNAYLGATPGYLLALQGSLRVGVSLPIPLVIEAALSTWWFPRDLAPVGTDVSVMGGLRFDPRIGMLGRVLIDAHGGVAFTGPSIRPALDVGVGFEFRVIRGLALGPIVRYGRVFQTENPTYYPEDAQFWSIGIAVTVRTDDPAPPAPPDADRDGVPDASDLCPREPAGRQIDPARRGCPIHDTDSDGLFDDIDQCATVPAGVHPDPARVGCPLRDTDGDGVFDNVDRCSSVPSGETPDPDRPGCPDPDGDSDGVTDHRDSCPTEAAGESHDPQRPGCPIGDRDHDSVADNQDHCPDQPGAPDPNPLRNGCPGLVQLEHGEIRILHPVFFASRRDTILRRSFPVLSAVANALVAVASIQRVSIEGHTDDVGNDAANLELSARRAQSVMAWLITHGVVPSRLEAHGFGETQPLVATTSAAAREANRRVQFRIVDPARTVSSGSPAPAAGGSNAPTP